MDIIQFILNQIDKPIKMIMYRFNIDKWSCRHCDGIGVCLKGWNNLGDKYSCKTCIREFDKQEFGSQVRVKCSVCNGTGRESNYLLKRKLKFEQNTPNKEKLI